jgi:transposase
MEAIVERCCGLDVHQSTVMACLLVGRTDEKPRRVIRQFGTMSRDLEALKAWLVEEQCTHVAMESTGVYWMPVFVALEGSVELIVGNATHIKNVPGRKTDVKDSEWIARLCRAGMIRKSLVPPKPLRVMREYVRYRRKLVDAQTAERNRLQRMLVTMNVKLASVMSDLFGVSGRRMLSALVAGNQSPAQMAALAKGKLRKKVPELTLALEGKMDDERRFLLEVQLGRLEHIESDIARIDAGIDAQLVPYREHHQRLMTIPGVDRVGAATIIAELGVDMSVFPSAGHAAAWAGVCPGNYESAGKTKGQASRKGNPHLTVALVQAAVCASKKRGSYLKEKYWRLKAKRGPKRAAVAVGHKILVAAYHILAHGVAYRDLGGDYLDQLDPNTIKRRLVSRLERLGYTVTLERAPAAATEARST